MGRLQPLDAIVLAPYDNEPNPPIGAHAERPLRLALTLPVRTRSTLWRFARVESISIRPEPSKDRRHHGPEVALGVGGRGLNVAGM